MGLPTKKQMNKHKRGTRKALDTLDTLSNEGDIEPENTPPKSQKAASKKTTTKKREVKEKTIPTNVQNHSKEKDREEIQIEPESPETISKKTNISNEAVSKTTAVESFGNETEDLEQKKATDQDSSSEKTITDSSMKKTANQHKKEAEIDVSEEDEDTQQDKYLTFSIGHEIFGIEIRFITEIIVVQKITAVPDTAAHIRGVINLRGKVIPVMDIRERFGLDLKEYDERTCIIVVNHKEIAVGLIVDIVNEVVDIPSEDVDPPPRTHSGIKANYIAGMGKIGADVKILLDIQNVLDIQDLDPQTLELS